MNKRTYNLTINLSTFVAIFCVLGIIVSLARSDRNAIGTYGSGLRTGSVTEQNGDNKNNQGGGGSLNKPGRYYPPGPYISFLKSSEMITLPEPTVPDLSRPRTNCPWEDATNLVSWHDDSTWGIQGVPSIDKQDVILPAGKRVVIRRSLSVRLGIVTIPANSELLFQEAADGIEMDAHGFYVAGKLIIGSPSCPIEKPITITLHGVRPDFIVSDPVQPKMKGIHVPPDGNLQIHGKQFFHSWTRLARTVDPSKEPDAQNILMLQQEVNWEPGQQVVITTSALKDSRDWHQNEVRTIEAIHENPPEGVGSVIYLTEPLRYRHVANSNYQVEVGLLSRVIKIQGNAEDSEPTDPDPLNCVVNRKLYGSDEVGTQCPDTETTGYGGHIMVEGLGQVEGVELYRMGQTNVEGRYPLAFHLIGRCDVCYFKHSSVHRSYYRCVVIQGTNQVLVTQNVAYDAIGHCFFMADGVEKWNTISYNLAAHVHWLGKEAAHGTGTTTEKYLASDTLAFPADVAASPFYIPNVDNMIVGNAASGGWSGFYFPNQELPMGTFRDDQGFWPSSQKGNTIKGNTAHSTGFWWNHAAAFYIGGGSAYRTDGKLEYEAGSGYVRNNCEVNRPPTSCSFSMHDYIKITNSKVFLVGGNGWTSWSGRFDLDGFEAHDTGMIVRAVEQGIWMNRLLHVCRTGESLVRPPGFSNINWSGTSIRWYESSTAHIVTNSVFRNCGVRAIGDRSFDEYDVAPTRGCPADDSNVGCSEDSSVWEFDSHSDHILPQVMQATKNITYDNCGRRYKFISNENESVSATHQNWIDADGTASGVGEAAIIGSGLERVTAWWDADDEAEFDSQGPLWFIKKPERTKRGLACVELYWDKSLHDRAGRRGYCTSDGTNCPPVGWVRHIGKRFFPDQNVPQKKGLPLTASQSIVGLSGGYGWLFQWDEGPPEEIIFRRLEIDPRSPLVVVIPYPKGTTFNIVARAGACQESPDFSCEEVFQKTDKIEEARTLGNKYHVDENGVLTFRLVQVANDYVGNPEWTIPEYTSAARNGKFLLNRFRREDITLPWFTKSPTVTLSAQCNGNGSGYCSGVVDNYDIDVCPRGFVQIGFDRCCNGNGNLNDCRFAN